MLITVEDVFGIEIPDEDEEKIETVGDVTRWYIVGRQGRVSSHSTFRRSSQIFGSHSDR